MSIEVNNESGVAVDEAEVVFWGMCPQCRATPHTPQPPTQKEQ